MQHQRHNNLPPADLRIHTSLRYDPALVTVLGHNPQISKCWNTDNPSPFLLLDLHRDRLLSAATHFNWPAAIRVLSGNAGLSLITTLPDHITTELQEDVVSGRARRLRVSVGPDGSVTHEIFDTPPRALESLFPDRLPPPRDYQATDDTTPSMIVAPRIPSPPYTILIDSLPSTPSIFTHFKTTERSVYDDARKRSITPSTTATTATTGLTEVLLVSNNSEHPSIMEGSFTTPYFWRQGRWVTPPVSVTPPPALGDSTGNGKMGNNRGCGGHDGVSRRWALERGLAIEQEIPVSSLVDGEECWLSNGAQGFLRGNIVFVA